MRHGPGSQRTTTGTLCTVHARRGVDPVPCLYAMAQETVGFG